MSQKLQKKSSLQKKPRGEELGERKILLQKQQNVKSETTLAILQPGKYLMLNRNKYIRVKSPSSVLLMEKPAGLDSKYIIALHDSDLLLVDKNEIEIA